MIFRYQMRLGSVLQFAFSPCPRTQRRKDDLYEGLEAATAFGLSFKCGPLYRVWGKDIVEQLG